MGFYRDDTINAIVWEKIDKGCTKELKKAAFKHLQTGRQGNVIEGMVLASTIIPGGDDYAVAVGTACIYIFKGNREAVIERVSSIEKELTDVPPKVLGKMVYIRLMRTEKVVKERNRHTKSQRDSLKDRGMTVEHLPSERFIPEHLTRESWVQLLDDLRVTPWGYTMGHDEPKMKEVRRFLARPDITQEILNIGLNMFRTKNLLES
jgi:hypothetical protein